MQLIDDPKGSLFHWMTDTPGLRTFHLISLKHVKISKQSFFTVYFFPAIDQCAPPPSPYLSFCLSLTLSLFLCFTLSSFWIAWITGLLDSDQLWAWLVLPVHHARKSIVHPVWPTQLPPQLFLLLTIHRWTFRCFSLTCCVYYSRKLHCTLSRDFCLFPPEEKENGVKSAPGNAHTQSTNYLLSSLSDVLSKSFSWVMVTSWLHVWTAVSAAKMWSVVWTSFPIAPARALRRSLRCFLVPGMLGRRMSSLDPAGVATCKQ